MEQTVEEKVSKAKESGISKVINNISRIMAAVGAVVFAAMMLITVIDVGGRKFFLHPLNGAVELIGLFLVIGGTWGMGYCHLIKMHIRINILTEKFGKKAQTVFWIITCFVSLVVSALIAWRAFAKVQEYLLASLGNRTDILSLPLWPFLAAMGIGFVWMGIVLIVDIIKSIAEVVKS